MIYCIRRLEWDAAHRVPLHESKCRALHGHRYAAELYCQAPQLDELGRVIDFSVIKELVGGWIDKHWDHTTILMHPTKDPEVVHGTERPINESAFNLAQAIATYNRDVAGRPVYWMGAHPTAENLAAELGSVANDLFKRAGSPVRCAKLRLWETPNGSVEWTRDGAQFGALS